MRWRTAFQIRFGQQPVKMRPRCYSGWKSADHPKSIAERGVGV